MIGIFREHGMGNFRDLPMRLSTSPAMMYYLDNTESHKVAVNENYGRELLELLSLGVGKDEAFNYTEDDVKRALGRLPVGTTPRLTRLSPTAAARGSSAMTRRTTMIVRRPSWAETGRWDGEDIVNPICKQPGTARPLSRHLYNPFVADEVPVLSRRPTPPKDPKPLVSSEKAYLDSGYEINAKLRALFTSNFFKAESVRFAKVKNPAEMVVSILRMTGDHRGEVKLQACSISRKSPSPRAWI